MSTNEVQLCCFFAIVFLAVLVYLPALDTGLFYGGGDADHALAAKKILQEGAFDAVYHPPFSFVVLAFSFALGGYTEFAARFSAMIFFVIGGYYVFRLANFLHSTLAGIIATFLYFFSPILSQGVFTYWMDIILMAFINASVYYLCVYKKTRRSILITLGGIFAGMAILTKETALFLFPVYFIVFKKDGRLWRLLGIMALFTGVWLISYELLDVYAYKSALLLPLERLIIPNPKVSSIAVGRVVTIVQSLTPPIFALAVVGGTRLFLRNSKQAALPILLSLSVLVLFSVSQADQLKYYFPAVPFLLVFASVAFLDFSALVYRVKFLGILPFIIGFYILGAYTIDFFEEMDARSTEWDDSPRFTLREFVINYTNPSDSLSVIDDATSDWIEFYTGRPTSYIPNYFPINVQYSYLLWGKPRYLIVHAPNGGVPFLKPNCQDLKVLVGVEENYTVYKCAWR